MDLKRAYEILGVNQNDNFDKVKKRYRELCKKYHPDLYQDQDKNIKELTEEKLKEINEAYSLIEKNYLYDDNQPYHNNKFSKMMKLFEYEWEIEKDLIIYNSLRIQVEQMMLFQLEFYKEKYRGYGSLDTFLNRDLQVVKKIIFSTFETLVKKCIELNYNPPSSRILMDTYNKRIFSEYLDFVNYCKEVLETFDDDLAYKKTKRKIKSSYSGSLLVSAIDGTLNMVDGFTSNQKKIKFYKSPEVIQSLCNILEKSMRECLNIIVELLDLKVVLNPIATISIIDNIEMYDIIKQKLKLVEAVKNDPYNKESYVLILHKFGDSNLELEKLANYFGISLEKEKMDMIEIYNQELKENFCISIDEAKNKFIAQMKNIGRFNSETEKYFKLQLEQFFKNEFEKTALIDFNKAKAEFNKNTKEYEIDINSEEYFITYEKKLKEKEEQIINEKKRQEKLKRKVEKQGSIIVYPSLILAIIAGIYGLTDNIPTGIIFFLGIFLISSLILNFGIELYNFFSKNN